jgi:hypothetical protein
VAITPFQEEGGQDGLGADDDDALVAEDEADGLDDEAHRPKEKSKICASVAQAGPRRRRWVKTARRQFSGQTTGRSFGREPFRRVRESVRDGRQRAPAAGHALALGRVVNDWIWRPRQDSNLRTRLRRPMLYPLSYEGGLRQVSRASR